MDKWSIYLSMGSMGNFCEFPLISPEEGEDQRGASTAEAVEGHQQDHGSEGGGQGGGGGEGHGIGEGKGEGEGDAGGDDDHGESWNHGEIIRETLVKPWDKHR